MGREKALLRKHGNSDVPDAARRALSSHLSDVTRYLTSAAKASADKPRAVHRLRISSRHAEAALRFYKPLLSAELATWFRRHLKRIRRAAGEARDLDVLLERIHLDKSFSSARHLSARLQKQRKSAQKPLRGLQRKLGKSGVLRRKTRKLDRYISRKLSSKKRTTLPDMKSWAMDQIQPVAADFLSAGEGRLRTSTDLHKLRIAGKRLRYALSLVAEVFPLRQLSPLTKELRQMQKVLGTLCDHAAAIETWGQLLADVEIPTEQEQLSRVIAAERKSLAASKTKFRRWWNALRRRRLRSSLTTIGLQDG